MNKTYKIVEKLILKQMEDEQEIKTPLNRHQRRARDRGEKKT